jgi:hypothetical protein
VSNVQSSIGADVTVVKTAANIVREQELVQPVTFSVKNTPIEGLSKVRRVGADNDFPRKKPFKKDIHCVLLGRNLIGNITTLQETTNYPETIKLSH